MARRRYQNGCLFKRGKNWVLRYRQDLLNSDGSLGKTHRSIVLGSLTSKKEARRAADAHLLQYNTGVRRPQAALTMGDFWFKYFQPEILPTLKFSTRRLCGTLATKHLLPEFGQQRLCDIARVQIQQFIGQKQRQGYSTQTLAHFRNLLSKVFGTAGTWGWMNHNPAREIKLPPMERRRKSRVLTPAEIGQLSNALVEPVRTVFLVGILTGLRIGELLALQVEDVDFTNRLLYVRRDVYRGVVGTPKTRTSERELPLASVVISIVQDWISMRRFPSAWLFPSRVGKTLNDRNLLKRHVWPACDQLGLPKFGWHSLGHTFSTYSGNTGVAMPVLQSLLGHTSSNTTMRYTHPLESAKRDAVEQVANQLFPSVPAFENCNGGLRS